MWLKATNPQKRVSERLQRGCRNGRNVPDRPEVGEEPQTICTLRYVRRTKEATAMTEAILEAIEEEVNGDPMLPTIIQ